jgi:hypothetical protein
MVLPFALGDFMKLKKGTKANAEPMFWFLFVFAFNLDWRSLFAWILVNDDCRYNLELCSFHLKETNFYSNYPSVTFLTATQKKSYSPNSRSQKKKKHPIIAFYKRLPH